MLVFPVIIHRAPRIPPGHLRPRMLENWIEQSRKEEQQQKQRRTQQSIQEEKQGRKVETKKRKQKQIIKRKNKHEIETRNDANISSKSIGNLPKIQQKKLSQNLQKSRTIGARASLDAEIGPTTIQLE